EDGAEFFGVTESPNHVPNECRIAFRASSIAEVDRLAQVVTRAGARHIEGPAREAPGYYAIFFEDPSGNRLEICHRV
ncbi:MAG: VOC family protein, partial [Verrucomicrobiota bacterium]